MKQFDQSYAEQLFELREMLETHSLQHFLNLPDHDPRWLQAKTMLERHRLLRDNIGNSFRMFSQLDRDFHSCFQLPTISFLINRLRSSQSSFIFTINGTKAILNSAISLPSMSI